MKLRVTNNGSDPHFIETRYFSIGVGATVVINNAVANDIIALKDESDIVLEIEYEAGDLKVYTVEWVATPDATGGATTSAIELRIVDQFGVPIDDAIELVLGAFDDAYCATVAANATMDTATKGTVQSGAASNALYILTDGNGEFACTLTDATDEQVYLAGGGATGKGIIDGLDVGDVTYSA